MRKLACILTLVFSFLFFLPSSVAATECILPPPSEYAGAAALYQPDTQCFLYEKNADTEMRMASTTKIMTALLTIENASLSDPVEVPPEASGVEGSSLYLTAGDTGTVEDFLYALLLASANDAAVTLAIHIAGSIPAFAEMMNTRAESLLLSHTHFDNPHGLDSDTHYTTAKDLACLAAEAMENPVFSDIVSTKTKQIRLNDGETLRTLSNHNRLLHSYEGANGVKTGFTKASGRCLVTSAMRDGVRLIAVTLSCSDDWQAHKSLLDYGFSRVKRILLAEKGEMAFRVPILGGKQSTVMASNPSPIYGLSIDRGEVETVFDMLPYPSAPLKKGTPLGKVSFYRSGVLIAESPLVAETTVQPIRYKRRLFGLLPE